MRTRISSLLVAGLLLLAAPPSSGGQAPTRPGPFLNPKLKAKEINIRTVVVLPSIVKITKQGVRGSEGMGKEEEEATSALASSVSAALTESGLSVEAPFTEEALKSNNELSYAVADVQRKFDEIVPQLYMKPKDVQKGRFSLGDMVAVLNTKGKADALVITRAEGEKWTKGKGMLTAGLIGLAASGNSSP